MDGAFLTTFMVIFREALEASLIVGIILTVLARLQQQRYFSHVFASVGLACLFSVAAGYGLMALTSSIQGDLAKIIEGGTSIIACGVLSYMVIWMHFQAKRIRPQIEEHLETAVTRGEYIAIVSLPFLAIFREGAETVLFLNAIAMKDPNSISTFGGLVGLVLAVLVVCAIFIGGKRVPLRPLFNISGMFLLFIAAGLLAYGVHEFNELGMIPPIIEHVWNINHILNEKQGVGLFLKTIFGYNGNPSLTEVVSYVIYLTGVIYLLKSGKLEIYFNRRDSQ